MASSRARIAKTCGAERRLLPESWQSHGALRIAGAIRLKTTDRAERLESG